MWKWKIRLRLLLKWLMRKWMMMVIILLIRVKLRRKGLLPWWRRSGLRIPQIVATSVRSALGWWGSSVGVIWCFARRIAIRISTIAGSITRARHRTRLQGLILWWRLTRLRRYDGCVGGWWCAGGCSLYGVSFNFKI